MSYTPVEPHSGLRRLTSRNPDNPHRAATPLELFFDLVFVVAIASAASGLHHAIADDHIVEGTVRYAFIFAAIWWPWMNHTWFSSAFDNDDALHRLCTFAIMVGVLVLTAGVSDMFDNLDMRLGLMGYLIMRLALTVMWLRVFRDDADMRPTALRYVIGLLICQSGWALVIIFAEGPLLLWLAAFLWVAEFSVPVFAETKTQTPWNTHHIIERFGLLTIIVLGESVLALSVAANTIAEPSAGGAGLWATLVGGLAILFAMWWIYFCEQQGTRLNTVFRVFLWGYSHYFIYAAVAAVGAGLAVVVDHQTGHSSINTHTAQAAVAIPAAAYLLFLWMIHQRDKFSSLMTIIYPLAAITVLASIAAPYGVAVTGVIFAACVIAKETMTRRI